MNYSKISKITKITRVSFLALSLLTNQLINSTSNTVKSTDVTDTELSEKNRNPKGPNIITVTEAANFDKLLNTDKPVIIKFSAEWCNPCKRVKPIISDISNIFRDRVTFIDVDFDRAGTIADKYKIKSVPTLIFIKNKVEIHRVIGANFTPKTLQEKIKEIFNL